MGFFSKPKTQYVTQETTESSEEAKETAAKKQRLLATQGGKKGELLGSSQGQSVRRIFGN